MARMSNPPWGLYVLTAAYLVCCARAQAASNNFDARGFSQDLAALLDVKRAIPNWNLYQQRSMCFGWHETPYDDVCQWTSVKCRNGVVVALQLQTNASFHLGHIQDVLKAAAGIPNLEVLDLAGQAFSGTLPTQYPFPNLLELNLIDNNIMGTIPAEWGGNALFPKLVNLSLSYNPPLSGTLPANWGSDNSSLTSLQLFQANNCNLTGPLPANWSMYLPALKDINISSNALSGTLPPQWSTLDLNTLNLDRNALTGTIPAKWGSGYSFLNLRRLSLHANMLSGTLPSTWRRNQFAAGVQPALPKLLWMDVSDNMLSGKLPDFGDLNRPPYFISNGNNFCGKPPQSLSVWDCASTCTKYFKWPACLGNDTSPAVPPPAPPLTSRNLSQAISPDMQKLLTLQTAFSNWDIYQRTQGLNWTSTATMCTGWQGVQCNTAGNVIGLNFSAPDIEPPQRLRALEGVTNMTVHSSQPIALQGNLSSVLWIASKLPRLASLDFRNAFLTGTIPSGLSFPSLQTLLLRSNGIQGTLPSDWAGGQAMPLLQDLDLSKNYQVSGSLPETWGNVTGPGAGLQSLKHFAVRSCNLTGTLPVSWANGLSGLSTLDLAYNYITGALPVEWQAMTLQILLVVGNGLNGTLPTGWAANGPASWQGLRELHLDANKLRGTLPASWGDKGSFPQLINVTLANNDLSGSLPAQWGLDATTFMTRFPRLESMTLLPGNMGLCGAIPSGLKVLQKTGGTNTAPALYLNNKPCSVSADTQIQSSGSREGSSQGGASTNMGAIIGGVVGGIVGLAAITALVLFFVLRQRRRNRAARGSSGLKNQWHTMPGDEKVHEDHYDLGPMHDSDNIIPPKSTAPASIVPFSQAPSSMGAHSGGSSAASTAAAMAAASAALSATHSGGSSKVPSSSFASQGSGYSSEPAKEGDRQPETLPHMFSKDWELNLDALEIELDEEGREVELGKGAFGVVVKGRYRLSPVAVKRLINQTPEQQAQFLKEMAILRACRGSRYIVPFVGASLQPGNTILAMDFMENGNLWDQLPRTNKAGQHIFQWKFRGKKVAYEIALGLYCLHDLKVVHLDLKSSNVLIAADGSAKISDVGLAALMSQNYLSQMAPAGTWSWVAPEVILGGKVTNKADIYSFGVVIWEICTLERPAWRGNLRPIRVPEEAPQEIADLVSRCTGDQEQRPTAQECAELLGSFLPLGTGRKISGRTTSGGSGRTPSSPTAKSSKDDAPKSSGSNPLVSGKGFA